MAGSLRTHQPARWFCLQGSGRTTASQHTGVYLPLCLKRGGTRAFASKTFLGVSVSGSGEARKRRVSPASLGTRSPGAALVR